MQAARIVGIVHLDGVARPLILSKITTQLESFSLCTTGSLTASSAAYMLDAKTAAALIDKATIERTVDDYLFDPTPADRGAKGHGLAVLQLEPIVAIQAQFGGFSDPARIVPPFLEVTKRADVTKRRSRTYVGPWPYQVRKELLRVLYRYRIFRRVRKSVLEGGRWAIPELCSDLNWH